MRAASTERHFLHSALMALGYGTVKFLCKAHIRTNLAIADIRVYLESANGMDL